MAPLAPFPFAMICSPFFVVGSVSPPCTQTHRGRRPGIAPGPLRYRHSFRFTPLVGGFIGGNLWWDSRRDDEARSVKNSLSSLVLTSGLCWRQRFRMDVNYLRFFSNNSAAASISAQLERIWLFEAARWHNEYTTVNRLMVDSGDTSTLGDKAGSDFPATCLGCRPMVIRGFRNS